MKRMFAPAVLIAGIAFGVASSPALAGYVAVTWGDNRVHFLDDSFNDLGSFAVGQSQPNAVASDGTTIWVGTFVDSTVRAFNSAGVQQYSWTASSGIQGMELVGNELAVSNAGNDTIEFYNPVSGTFIRSIPGSSSVEGLAYDGTYLWAIEDAEILGLDPTDGSVDTSIPNSAVGCSFAGTGLANAGAGQLAAACSGGNWFVVSSADGSTINSGNNQLEMYGLSEFNQVPEPGALALLGLGLGLLAVRRARS